MKTREQQLLEVISFYYHETDNLEQENKKLKSQRDQLLDALDKDVKYIEKLKRVYHEVSIKEYLIESRKDLIQSIEEDMDETK